MSSIGCANGDGRALAISIELLLPLMLTANVPITILLTKLCVVSAPSDTSFIQRLKFKLQECKKSRVTHASIRRTTCLLKIVLVENGKRGKSSEWLAHLKLVSTAKIEN
jgi:hypothetical protein